MKKVVDNYVTSSLKEFLQYTTCVDLEAASMHSGQFYEYTDEQLPGQYVYGSSFAPWAYDNSIPGITVPTSFGGYDRTSLSMDFQNGRVISPTPLNLTGTYNFPLSEVSYFVSSMPDWALLDEGQFNAIPDMAAADTYIPPYKYITPCVFLKAQSVTNLELCLGGEYWSVWNFRLTTFCRNEYELVAIQKVIRDCKGRIFDIIPETPFGPNSDLKFGHWNYPSFLGTSYYAFIEDSSFKILEPDLFTANHPSTFMGVGTIEVRVPRFPNIANSDPDLSYAYAETDIDDIFSTENGDNVVLV